MNEIITEDNPSCHEDSEHGQTTLVAVNKFAGNVYELIYECGGGACNAERKVTAIVK